MAIKGLNETLGKYKGIIVSVALFLLLDASILVFNVYISYKIADDASAINLAGRQRMLSQRMTKSLYDMAYSLKQPIQLKAAIQELQATSRMFDQTLRAFSTGGQVTGVDGQNVTIQAVKTQEAKNALADTSAIWHIYQRHISELTHDATPNAPVNSERLTQAITFARANNLFILEKMNALTSSLENTATEKALELRLIQTFGLTLAIINFLIILFHFLKQLRNSDKVLESARRETSDILETVNEGLFLIDRQLTLSSQYSQALENILGTTHIAERQLDNLLHSMVSAKDLQSSQDFIALLFNPKIKARLITDLNPLDQVEVNITNEKGNFTTKYLSFEFSRVTTNDTISHVLISVRDITETVLLSREVKRLKDQENEQLEMLTSILHTNSDLIQGFINQSFVTFNKINEQLKRHAKSPFELRQKIDVLLREMHSFKGEAASLRLEKFAALAHDFESILSTLKSNPQVTGNDFLGLTLRLDNLISYTQSIDVLISKLSEFNCDKQPSVQKTAASSHLSDFVDDLCEKNNKQARLYCSGLDEYTIDDGTRNLINDIVIQFIRNAIAHGIETPDERRQAQKKVEARIDCHLSLLSNGTMELVFEDDGKGIDYDAIRHKAVASGKWATTDIDSWDKKRLLSLIFIPGFSTLDNTTRIAGRGIGMDIIKENINLAQGKLQILSRKGQGTRFTVLLPTTTRSQSAA